MLEAITRRPHPSVQSSSCSSVCAAAVAGTSSSAAATTTAASFDKVGGQWRTPHREDTG